MKIKAWAIVKQGCFVVHNSLLGLLMIFFDEDSAKATKQKGERVIPVWITDKEPKP